MTGKGDRVMTAGECRPCHPSLVYVTPLLCPATSVTPPCSAVPPFPSAHSSCVTSERLTTLKHFVTQRILVNCEQQNLLPLHSLEISLHPSANCTPALKSSSLWLLNMKTSLAANFFKKIEQWKKYLHLDFPYVDFQNQRGGGGG